MTRGRETGEDAENSNAHAHTICRSKQKVRYREVWRTNQLMSAQSKGSDIAKQKIIPNRI